MTKQQNWGADMSWMQKLYETYEQCSASESLQSDTPLAPLSHVIQQAHIEIVLDGDGNFRRARVIEKENTVIPATEKSATARTSGVVPHPLCDHVKYCAADYVESGKTVNKYFVEYKKQLKAWCESPHSHPKAIAVLTYVAKGRVVADLVSEGVLPVAANGGLLTSWEPKENKPLLFKQLTKDPKTKEYKPQNALIRWVIETTELISETWKDPSLKNAWIDYSTNTEAAPGLCMVTGICQVLADKHPKGMRGGQDGAKLISYKKEADSDFIYLGRFIEARQVVGVGSAVTQKAHSALRWLIERQGYRNGNQAIVAWAIAGDDVPDWSQDTNALFLSAEELKQITAAKETEEPALDPGDVGQAFANRLNNAIRGYRANLGPTNAIVVMGLDSASKGRMAITYYRELTGSEYLDHIEAWHEGYAWHQDYGIDQKSKRLIRFVGAPSPRDIAEAAYGQRAKDKQHEKLIKATVERLLPCIIDGRPIPRDLVKSAVHRTCNRAAFKKDKKRREWEWEKNLGIACALFRGHYKERSYKMALELDRTSRDYLFGRLLAVAEGIEDMALYLADEKRDTNAAKLMQRFADHPYSTWRTIELSLAPYKTRLRSLAPKFLHEKMVLLDEIMGTFNGQDFMSEARLSGEFLLGYHCQRLAPRPKSESTKAEETTENQTNQGE